MTKRIDIATEPDMDTQGWQTTHAWHDLLDTLCFQKGYVNHSDLAYAFCQKTGKTSQTDMETATRNINNWRSGSHIPNRKNIRILADILAVSRDERLKKHWYALYRDADKSARQSSALPLPSVAPSKPPLAVEHTTIPDMAPLSSTPAPSPVEPPRQRLYSLLFVGALVGASGLVWWGFKVNTEQVQMSLLAENNIPWIRNLTLHVGEEAVVHGKRGTCGELPASPEKIEKSLPKHLKTGILTTGRLGLRTSRRCDGATPAREIVFQARKPGKERLHLYGDAINIHVLPKSP